MLDTFTLVVCTTLINAMMIATLIALYRTSPSEKSILDWLCGISCFFASNLFGVYFSLNTFEHWMIPAIANTLYVSGYGFILGGIYRYINGKSIHKYVAIISVLVCLLHLTPFAQQSIENRTVIIYPFIIGLCLAATVLLCRQYRKNTLGLLPLTLVTSSYTIQLTVRLLALMLDKLGISIIDRDLLVNSSSVCMMLYVMALPMSVAYLINWARVQSLRTMSHTDTLTGWLNRRSFATKMPALFSLTRRRQQPFACIVLDIDLFKQVNDNYGHAVGDEVLIHISHQVRRVTKDCEDYFRLGGEEFVLLFRNCDEKQAMAVAERVRKAVYACPYLHGKETISCSVSLGVAVLPGACSGDWEGVIQAADNALYKAKASGRNSTCLAAIENVHESAANHQYYQASKNLSA